MLRFLLYVSLVLFTSPVIYSQGLTGTWEGNMGDEFLQINITEKDGELCGYTYDYILGNPRDHCVAYYKGGYNESSDVWIINGVSFIENSGSHVLMRLRLWRDDGDGKNTLKASVATKSIMGFLNRGRGEVVELKRVSRRPKKLPDLPPCFPEPPKPPEATIKRADPMKPSPERPPVTKTVPKPVVPKAKPVEPKAKPVEPKKPVAEKKVVPKPVPKVVPPKPAIVKTEKKPVKDSVAVVKRNPAPPPAPIQTDKQVVKKLAERRKTEFSHITVDVKSIKLSVYDNGVVDGDTVSIFYNGRMLVGKKRISAEPLVLNLELDENAGRHEITMFAENLGSIPPNTALIVVTAGDKRYELHSSASLEENAVLVFEYKPK